MKRSSSRNRRCVRLRQEKVEIYQAAVNAWKNGEVSQALSRMRLVLDLDQKAPDVTSPALPAPIRPSTTNSRRTRHHQQRIRGSAAASRRSTIRAGIKINNSWRSIPGMRCFSR